MWIGLSRGAEYDKRLRLRWIMSVWERERESEDASNKRRSARDAGSSVWLGCLLKRRSFPTCDLGITHIWPPAAGASGAKSDSALTSSFTAAAGLNPTDLIYVQIFKKERNVSVF